MVLSLSTEEMVGDFRSICLGKKAFGGNPSFKADGCCEVLTSKIKRGGPGAVVAVKKFKSPPVVLPQAPPLEVSESVAKSAMPLVVFRQYPNPKGEEPVTLLPFSLMFLAGMFDDQLFVSIMVIEIH